jgi:hypothetical protein
MGQHVFMIITQARPAPEAEAFDEWYVGRHMPDVLAVPGFVSGQRYRLAHDPAAPDGPTRYLTIYEIETDDRAAVLAELRRRAGTDEMPLFPGGGESAATSMVGEAVTERMTRKPDA